MNNNINNSFSNQSKNSYIEMMNEVHVSEDLLEKVKNMNNNKSNKLLRLSSLGRQHKTGMIVAAAVAFAIICAISGNAIVYAATGTSLVNKIKVTFDGVEHDAEITEFTDEDGNTCYRVDLDGDDEKESFNIYQDGTSAISATLVTENDKVFLVVGDNDQKIDITKDLTDGTAEGKITIENTVYNYTVTGTITDYDIQFDK